MLGETIASQSRRLCLRGEIVRVCVPGWRAGENTRQGFEIATPRDGTHIGEFVCIVRGEWTWLRVEAMREGLGMAGFVPPAALYVARRAAYAAREHRMSE